MAKEEIKTENEVKEVKATKEVNETLASEKASDNKDCSNALEHLQK